MFCIAFCVVFFSGFFVRTVAFHTFDAVLFSVFYMHVWPVWKQWLQWQPAGIKFTQSVSGQNSVPLQENYGLKNDSHLLELSRRSLSACKVWGDQTTRASCRCENWCFCMSHLVCLHVGDIVQTSIVWRFMCRFSWRFQCFFRIDCSFRCTT